MASTRTRHARDLFAPLGPTYDRYARLLSFGQDPRWRSFLVSRIPADAQRVLDVASGTAAVAIELVRADASRAVVGVDQSSEMLAAGSERVAHEGLNEQIELREARAEDLPFADGEFDALTFTYLLRYVDDVPATLRELARVVRPGGTVAMLEFGLPRGVWRPLWELYVRVGLPAAGSVVSSSWGGVGRFLGPSIRDFWHDWPEPRLLDAWREAGLVEVRGSAAQRRRRDRRLGNARMTAARPRPAFYALRPGGWRDYVTLLHPPYTLWHLSYVAVGAALAPRMDWALLGWTTLAFALAMGVGAHALDELRGRPLQTRISPRVLVALAAVSISAAAAIGIAVAISRTLWLVLFVAVGAFFVVAYNLELFDGRFHGGLWFPAAWGAFPVLTAYFASAETLHAAAFAGAGYAFATSWAQRRLSTPVRLVRRRVVAVEGVMRLDDGTTVPLDADALAAEPEVALKMLAAATVLIAAALLLLRAG